MLVGLICASLAAVLYGLTSVLQAVAVRRLPDPSEGWLRLVRALLSDKAMLLVIVTGLVGWGLHLVAIKYLPLYLVQAVIAASLIVTAITSVFWLRERLGLRHWIAAAAACLGLAVLALSSGHAGHGQFTIGKTLALYAGLVVIGLAGLVAVRRPEPRGGTTLAWLSGIAYAGIPLSTRALTEPHWNAVTLAAAGTVGFYGLLGFWLYSVALQRITATASTAPLVLAETVVPAVLGVLWLGDGIRHGWLIVGLAGLAVSLVGVLGLADVETSPMVGAEAAPPEGASSAGHRNTGSGQYVGGTVREWHGEDGWGVVDAAEAPGGCWVSFADVRMTGYRELVPGAQVAFTYEAADQDGYAFRAVAVWPPGVEPGTPDPAVRHPPGGAYSSTLSIELDGHQQNGPSSPAAAARPARRLLRGSRPGRRGR